MKIECIAKNGWVETFLLNDRFIIKLKMINIFKRSHNYEG
jgi:hypothetical protein